MRELGIPILDDINNGLAAGAALIPNNIHPENQSRSDARVTYYDPFVSRPNFHIATTQFVTRVLIEAVGGSGGVDNLSGAGSGSGPAVPSDAPRPAIFGNGTGLAGNTNGLSLNSTKRSAKRSYPAGRWITGVEVSQTRQRYVYN